MRGILFLKNSIAAREPPVKSETGLKPAPRVIKTRMENAKRRTNPAIGPL